MIFTNLLDKIYAAAIISFTKDITSSMYLPSSLIDHGAIAKQTAGAIVDIILIIES